MTDDIYDMTDQESSGLPHFAAPVDKSDPPPAANTGIVPRQTIADIVRCRNAALALYEKAYETIVTADGAVKAAHEMANRASHFKKDGRFTYHLRDSFEEFTKAVQLPDREFYLDCAKAITDASCWATIIDMSGLEMLMDKQAKDELHQQMQVKKPRGKRGGHEVMTEEDASAGMPELTVENVQATLERFIIDADMIFKRGVANVFSKLDRRFRSHDGFKIGGRIILDRAFDGFGSWYHSGDQQSAIIDIERTFTTFDNGQPVRHRYGSIVQAIENDRRGGGYGPRQSETESEYFKVRVFKNGNAHIWFQRDDLVEKVNKLLADYYGEVIGDGMTKTADPFKEVKNTPAKHFGFYPSPERVVNQLLDPHGWRRGPALMRSAGESQLAILEPSAGTGNIARRCILNCKEATKDWAGNNKEKYRTEYRWDNAVDCVETQHGLAHDLKRCGLYRHVYNQDFLALSPETTGLYDYVIGNPPFDLERDIDHFIHAWKFLKPTGAIHMVMSAGTEFRETRKTIAFRDLIAKHNGSFEDLPPASFAECGTYVNTCIVRCHRDGSKS